MAPTNKSGKTSPNILWSEQTERIGARYRQETVSEFDVQNRISDLEGQLFGLQELEGADQDPHIQKRLASVERALEAAQSRHTQLRLSRNIIMRRGLESMTSEMRASPTIEREAAFEAGLDPMGVSARGIVASRMQPQETSFAVRQRLIKEQQDLRQQMKQNATEYETVARGMIETTDPNRAEQLGKQKESLLESRRGIASRLAATQAGLSYLGADERTLMQVQMSAIENVRKREQLNDLSKDPVIGKMSLGELRQRSESLEGQVTTGTVRYGELETKKRELEAKGASQEDIAQASKEAAEALKELTQSTTELQKTQTALAAGGSGGGGLKDPSVLRGMGQILGNVGQIGLTAAEIYRTATIEAPNLTTSNRIRAARMSNELYETRKAALRGDMQSLTLLDSPAFKIAEESAAEHEQSMRRTSYGRVAAYGTMAAGALAATVGGALSATGAGAVAGVPLATLGGKMLLGGAVAAGIAGTVSAGGAAVQEAMMADPQAVNEKLSERQRQIELGREVLKVSGTQRQAAYDYYRGTMGAAAGLGVSRAGAFMSTMAGAGADAMLQRMQAAGIGTDQMAQLSTYGIEEAGSVFGTNQIFQARGLESAGLGRMEQHVQRQAMMAQAGANNPQASYASLIEAAMTKSLDSAKSLNIIAQATTQTAQASQGFQTMGLDVTGAAMKELTAMVSPDAVNKEADLGRALSTREKMERMATDTSASFIGMMNIGRIQKTTGLGYEQAVVLGQMESATLATLSEQVKKAQSPEERKKAAEAVSRAGLSGLVNDRTGEVDIQKLEAAERAKTIQKLQFGDVGIAAGLTSRRDFKKFMEEVDVTKGDPNEILKKDEYKDLRNKMDTVAALQKLDREQALRSAKQPNDSTVLSAEKQLAVEASQQSGTPLEKLPSFSKLSPEQQKTMKEQEAVRTSAAKQQTEEVQKAAETMKNFQTVVSGIVTATEILQKQGAEPGEKFSKAAAKAATDFSESSKTFTTGLDTLGKALAEAAINIKMGKWPEDDKSGKR
jgi:hypothetical protein